MCKDHDMNYQATLDNDPDYQDWLDQREREVLEDQMEMEDTGS